MAQVFIPAALRPLANGEARIEVDGTNVRQVLAALRARHPDLVDRIASADGLLPGVAVAIDGHVAHRGLLTPVNPSSEVHFLPAVGGG